MADYLEPVVATFLAQADKYLGPVKDMRTAALLAAKANDELAESIVRVDDVMADLAGPAAAAAGRINDVRNAAAGAAGADESLARESEAAGHAMADAAIGAEAMAHGADIAGDAVGELGGDFEMMSRFALEARERLNNASAAIDAMGAQSKAAAIGINDLRDAAAEAAAAVASLERHITAASLAASEAAIGARPAMEAWQESIASASKTAAFAEEQIDAMARALDVAAASGRIDASAMNDLRNATLGAAFASAALKNEQRDIAAPAAAAAASWRLLGTGIRVGATAIHAMVSGFIEFLAVAIPAAIAAGAWAAAWAEGAGRVYEHMNALYTATEATSSMFHTTTGQALGLGDALQKAQTAADPNVYQALGGAINAARGHMGGLAQAGLQLGRIFDTFMAKVVYDMSAAGGAGGKLSGLLSDMVPDLVEFGQIFGNLGHALLNFASDMPGIANGMLAFFDAVSKVILAISRLPRWLVMGAFALHEFNIWGSVLNSTLGKLGFSVDKVSGSFFGLARAKSIFLSLFNVIPRLIGAASTVIGTLIGRLAGVVPQASKAGTAMVKFGANVEEGAAAMSFATAAAITLGVAGIGFLLYKLITAKTASQRFAASLQEAADKASNLRIFGVLADDMGLLGQKAAQATATLREFGGSTVAGTEKMHAFGSAATGVSNYLNETRASVDTLTAAQKSMAQQFTVAGAHAEMLAKTYGTSFVGALALADVAGVHLNQTLTKQSWAMAQIKIEDQVRGYRAMGQSMGEVGKDMTALAIQSGLAASKVSQLNSAWDDFMSNLTGGTGSLAGFETSLKNIGQVAGTGAKNLATSTASMSLSTKQFADQLTHFTGEGASAWTNFTQVMGSTAPQMADWLRTAGAEGALTSRQLSQAFLAIGAQLVPLAAKSKTAQAELLGFIQEGDPGIKTFKELADKVKGLHDPTGVLAKLFGDATVKMGDMAKVAAQLGTVMNNDINNVLETARLKVSNYSNDVATADRVLENSHGSLAKYSKDVKRVGQDVYNATHNMSAAKIVMREMEAEWNRWHPADKYMNLYYQQHGTFPAGQGPFPSGGGPGGHGGPGNSVMIVHQHIAGSVLSDQQLGRATQGARLRQTLRNGSTQAFIPGRLH